MGKGRAGRARGGARRAGRAGRLPARGSPSPALWGSAAQAPAHTTLRPGRDDPAGPPSAGPARGGANSSGTRPVSARARGAEDRGPAPPGPGRCRAGASRAGSGIRTPRTPAVGSTWTLGRRGTAACPPPARGGRGAATGFPFSAAQPGEVIAQRGGAGRTQVSASPAPLSPVGRGRSGTPGPPRSVGCGSLSAPRVVGEALRPLPPLIGRAPASQASGAPPAV